MTAVIHLTKEQAVADIHNMVDTLLSEEPTAELLHSLLTQRYEYALTSHQAKLVDRLEDLIWLMGGPSLPCCNHHDEHIIDQWVTQVLSMYNTHQPSNN